MPWKATEKVPISFGCSGSLEEALSSKSIKKYLYLVFLHITSCKMYRAPQVLVLAPLEGGTVIVLETLKLLVLQSQASDLKTVVLQKETIVIQTWSPFTWHLAQDIRVCLIVLGGDYCLPSRPAVLLPAAHTAFVPGATAWEAATLQHQGHPRELSHILGRLSHLLCRERTALVKRVLMNWQKGQEHSLPCQNLHIYTSPECCQDVSRQQTLRPPSCRPLLFLKFSRLWEEGCVSTPHLF